ncbi:MAG TPA: hypothetical protein VGG32_05990 [Thermoplasmata archaeon]|jgi:hypothetical protein
MATAPHKRVWYGRWRSLSDLMAQAGIAPPARKAVLEKVHGIIDDTRGFHSEAGSDSAWASLQLVVTEDAAPPTGTAPVTAPTPA